MKGFFLLIFLLTSQITAAQSFGQLQPTVSFGYPNFDDNPLFSDEMKARMRPHLMPINHPVKMMLDWIFIEERVTFNEESLVKAGFEILLHTPHTYIILARHPQIKGYLFKIYVDSEERQKDNRSGSDWLCSRCQGAENIRQLIKSEKIKNFIVPDKWLYPLPYLPRTTAAKQELVVLIVTDMQLVSSKMTRNAWKTVDRETLKELKTILSNGFGSAYLPENVPYTKLKKFAFIDTEHPQRQIDLHNVIPYLSEEMRPYWNYLIE